MIPASGVSKEPRAVHPHGQLRPRMTFSGRAPVIEPPVPAGGWKAQLVFEPSYRCGHIDGGIGRERDRLRQGEGATSY